MRNRPTPTDAEMEILHVLWRRGPSTVREVMEAAEREDVGYTTVLKLLQIMHEKRLVSRDESQRAHVYAAAVSRKSAQGQLLRELADRAFGGSAQKLVLRVLDAEQVSDEEREQIRHILKSYSEEDNE